MPYLFSSESVSEGHPDKIADQISDAILDAFLAQDPDSRVACETLVTTGMAIISGEVRSHAYVDVQKIVRGVINRIGYTHAEYQFDGDACGVMSSIHEQSPDIARGVDVGKTEEEMGAGDQGMMFGYATNETTDYMPLALHLSHLLVRELAAIRRENQIMTYLRPDSKAQVTIEYGDDHIPVGINTILVSTQHDPFDEEKKMLATIRNDIQKYLIPRIRALLPERTQAFFDTEFRLLVNPTGKFVIGGPHGDTGLTGRKIIVDTYGGKGAHGGGAFSGKDASKVDRSAAYATRHIAKNLVAAGVADQCLVQVAYAIGVPEPMSIFVDTYGTCKIQGLTDGQIARKVDTLFDMRPSAIISRLGLKNPIFFDTAAYGHMGRKPGKKKVMLGENGKQQETVVETFTWEKLNMVDEIRHAFEMD